MKHLSQGPAAAPRRLCRLLSSTRPLCCLTLTSHVFSSSSLHMARVSFARSHLYFDSLPLMTHFFCLTRSAVRILINASYKAPGVLSAREG